MARTARVVAEVLYSNFFRFALKGSWSWVNRVVAGVYCFGMVSGPDQDSGVDLWFFYQNKPNFTLEVRLLTPVQSDYKAFSFKGGRATCQIDVPWFNARQHGPVEVEFRIKTA